MDCFIDAEQLKFHIKLLYGFNSECSAPVILTVFIKHLKEESIYWINILDMLLLLQFDLIESSVVFLIF